MKEFASSEKFFAAFRGLVARIEKQGNAEAARELRGGFACLNGLTDGWALLMESIDRTIKENKGRIPEPEMSELRGMFKSVKAIVHRG